MTTKALLLAGLLAIVSSFVQAQCGPEPASGTSTYSAASNIPNSYYPGTGNPTSGSFSLITGTLDARGSSTVLASDDLVLIIQMQGADFNTSNTDAYGDAVAGGNAAGYIASSNLYAGYYEYNVVSSVSGSTINFTYPLTNNYYTRAFGANGIRAYQVVRIPRAFNLTIDVGASITCPAWNGSTGGIVALEAVNVLTLNGSINVSGRGFRGGGGINFTGVAAGNTNGSGAITNTDFRWASAATTPANSTGASKGEGIAGRPRYLYTSGNAAITTASSEGYVNGSMGRGAPGNAGGGATDGQPSLNGYNPGGGGGGNAGAGGRGGSGWHGGAGNLNSFPSGGYGGAAFDQRSPQRLIMGGGGGAGTANNSAAATSSVLCSGASGGGIILLRAGSYAGNGTILASGAAAQHVTGSGNTDAAGGGGAGGTIVAVTRGPGIVGLNNISANAAGGAGGNMQTYHDHGPGGGGGGGMIITNGSFASTNVSGGVNGLTHTGSTAGPLNNSYGATAGAAGQLLTLSAAPNLLNPGNGSSPCGTLPITIQTFAASLTGQSVSLTWTVTDAINFQYFEVEYSHNGSDFQPLAQVAFSNNIADYQYTHSPVTTPLNYYRLKLVDADGRFKYSRVLLVRINNDPTGLRVYPVPARELLTVSVAARSMQVTSARIFNAAGSLVKEQRINLQAGTNTFLLTELDRFATGIYSLMMLVDGQVQSSRIMVK